MLEHNGRFNSHDYDKFERMELTESPVRDAIHELKTYSLETLAQRVDARLFRYSTLDQVGRKITITTTIPIKHSII